MRTSLLAAALPVLLLPAAALAEADPTRTAAVDLLASFMGADDELAGVLGKKDRECLATWLVDRIGMEGIAAMGDRTDLGEDPEFVGLVVSGLVDCRLLDNVLAHEFEKQGVHLGKKARACLDRVSGEKRDELQRLFGAALQHTATEQDEMAMGLMLLQCLDAKALGALANAAAE